MSDYISRESVYETLREYYHLRTEIQHSSLRDALGLVPAADVKPVVRGKWIDDGSGCVVCSECGEEHEWGMFRANFCDNCGVDMREELNADD